VAYTTINDPSAYFQTKIYTGNGGSLAVTNDGNSNLQPDLAWFKKRGGSEGHALFDTSRGIDRFISSSSTAVEQHQPTTGNTDADDIASFDSDGFTFQGGGGAINQSSNTYVAWQWKANGGTTSSNTDGNVTVTLQANTTAGFSIGTFTSNGNTSGTIGHGLGARPDIVITKERDDTGNWNVIVPDYAGNEMAFLQSNAAFGAASGINTVGASTFTDGDGADSNDRVFFAFRSIQGYSKIGQYIGNGNANGPFAYTGFKPAWLLIKNASSAGNSWCLLDNKRQGFNPENDFLFPNASDAESVNLSNHGFDFLSNGFKNRGTGQNDDGDIFVYMAFAEHPFVSSKGVPTTAR